MGAGSSKGAALRRLIIGCVAAAAATSAVCGQAAAAGPGPIRAAEFKRLTDQFLRTAPTAGTARAQRRGGGVGIGPTGGKGTDTALLPDQLAVALYGAPQLTSTAVGKRSPSGAARKLRRQARVYSRTSALPVALSINLIGVVATASAGGDRKYRARQDPDVIRTYLKAARSVGARLTLDIQPGRSPLIRELRALRKWIELPDVDIGVDPEWNVGPKGVPGRDEGSIGFRDLNRASKWIEGVVEQGDLPSKAMIVHQFRAGSIKGRKRIRQRQGTDVLLNFDGIGSRAAKKSGYSNLATNRALFNGFSLFYDRDRRLMTPRAVLGLKPTVSYAMYQ
ncbi:MAG: hypothetical protein E4H22_00475 [Solirubrobacterales bacterium]|nr:MAG: hypothetical protein E4H22_00475 [Solirubrobacterales bacterium]